MSISTTTTWVHLAPKPGLVYRQLFVRGRNIAARTLYGLYVSEDEPRTPEQIAADYESPLEAVREAIACCESDPAKTREDGEREEATSPARSLDGSRPHHPANSQPLV
jgi:uncharacterized protein (DUF433 family)